MRKKKIVDGFRTASIEELKRRLNDKFGAGTALSGSDVAALKIEFFSTGSIALDVSLRGGFPYNRLVELIGGESSCKTSTCHLASSAFIRENPTGIVVHVDLENSIDFQWMKKLGCDLGKKSPYVFAYADSGEQAGDIVDEVVTDAEVPLLVILDSIMGAVPMHELEAPMDQKFMGQQPALINRIIRVTNARIKKAKVGVAARTTMILVNQTRAEIGGNSYAPTPGYSAGGQGRKFFCGQRIVFTSSTPEKEEAGQGDYKHTTRFGKKVHFQVIKNKCGGPEETGHFVFYNRPKGDIPIGIDNAEAIVSNGLLYEVLKRIGNSVYYKKHQLGGSTDKAMASLRRELIGGHASELVSEIKEAILAAAIESFGGTHEVQATEGSAKIQIPRRKLRIASRR